MKGGKKLTEEEQRKVFATNLNHYINASGKQQKEVAEDLGFSPTTFNTWCTGKILPRMGKIQSIADYFGILKTDLLNSKDYKNQKEEFMDVCVKIASKDECFQKIVIDYYSLTEDKKKIFCDFFENFVSRN